jgi:hypothetical protein
VRSYLRRLGLFLLGLGGSALASCADTDIRPPPDVVFALFDPAASPPQIPLPNDLTGQPAPLDAPAVASFSGPLDPGTVQPQSVLAIDLTTQTPIIVSGIVFDPSTNRIVVMPPAGGWPLGHRVAIVLRDRASGLQGAAGQPVVASPAFYFARSQTPISNCTAPAVNCTSASSVIPVEQAIGLERLRQGFAPLFAGLEAFGIPRNEVVLAWTFTVAGDV